MEKKRSVVTIGLASLITFFTMLLLTSFSTLIVSSARSDLNLSNKTAVSISNYYDADYLAEKTLQEISELRAEYLEDETNEEFNSESFEAFYRQNGYAVSSNQDNPQAVVVEFETEIDNKKIILATIEVPHDISKPLVRLSWQIELT